MPSPAATIAELWQRLQAAAAGPARAFLVIDTAHAGSGTLAGFALKRLHLRGEPQPGVDLRLGLFGGLHGDEPASVTGLLRFLLDLASDRSMAAGYSLTAFPECNPSGLAAGSRHNDNGLDLNREFWKRSAQDEIRVLERALTEGAFDGVITLHADDTAVGCYGYSWGRVLNEALLTPALEAASTVLPIDPRPQIDGFPAVDGKIVHCFQGVLAPPPAQSPRPFEIIIETPALQSLALQTEAHRRALHAILAAHRRLLSYAAEL